jgi:anhydro-N-acetylmuramic acid kinase
MNENEKYNNKNNWLSKPRLVCGLMSGTSLDGVDAALVRFENVNNKIQYELIGFITIPYPEDLKKDILEIINNQISISKVSELNTRLSIEYASAIKQLCSYLKIDLNTIDLIGMHGQTVWHNPNQTEFPSTLQLGSAPKLAIDLNIPVISDFRSADIALGGQGAPLVPVFDRDFLSEANQDVIALNIGGISNITYLPADKSKQIIAFDTGPGNVLIDTFCKKIFDVNYDDNGNIAREGKLIESLFNEMKKEEYIFKLPPKSTGRELFNQEYILNLLDKIGVCYYYKKGNSENRNEDGFSIMLEMTDSTANGIIHTLTKFTAWSIAENIKLFANPKSKIIVSGGGAKNSSLIQYLSEELSDSKIITSDEINLNSDAKEAICFAYLAYLNLAGIAGNIPSVTGATRPAVLGSLTFP